ncbi:MULTISPECIES: hypothetical protein [Acinetobacter]|uniref:Uncharacterized protein n=1 Tax=Acinetobacter ursingii TaxID=108980 RepID=A0A7T9Z6B8_9GAMM|nr:MULTISPECIES: hypothetical protein [Acinetobacter]ENX48790.1 hypothetical protein F943_02327 [Acinetobacter ursingii NIPH 706]EXD37931.1 hypothetical protein J500_0392 [Acinetobacter sp. 479375]MCH2014673.1 hypothetical protein [Acinetobacter ursingii]MCU4587437.1 hypothetical protein [Acinetobacter ursingii]QQT85794.1 hypothetical protein I6I53_12965 [Acinetobacter ursingii]
MHNFSPEHVNQREACLNRHRTRMFLERNAFMQRAEAAEFELGYQRQKYRTMFFTLVTIILALAWSLSYVVFF